MKTPVSSAIGFLKNPINSYARLAEHLNTTHPRKDGERWTKDSAYHLCRKNGISSARRCRSQPLAGISQRTRTRTSILTSLLAHLTTSGATLASIAPFTASAIARLSKHSIATVASNWHQLEPQLLSIAGLPPKPTVLKVLH